METAMSPRRPRGIPRIAALGAAAITALALIGGSGPVSGAGGDCVVQDGVGLPKGGSGNGNGNGNRGSFNGNGNSGNGNGNANWGSANGNLNAVDGVGNGYLGNFHDNLITNGTARPPQRPNPCR